jgi:hypothetical protein
MVDLRETGWSVLINMVDLRETGWSDMNWDGGVFSLTWQ